MSVRVYVFQKLANDAAMNALGIDVSTLFSSYAPDSPPRASVFGVLRWGPENPGLDGQRDDDPSVVSPVAVIDCELWVYDNDRNYDKISAIIKRWRRVMESLPAARTGVDVTDGWITQADWQGDGDDTYDDAYDRVTRSSSCRIVASGA